MELAPRRRPSHQRNFPRFTFIGRLMLMGRSMPRHLTRPQGEMGTMLWHILVFWWDLACPRRPCKALNPYLAAVTRPNCSVTSTSKPCSATHASDAFPDIKLEVIGIFVHRNWTHGCNLG